MVRSLRQFLGRVTLNFRFETFTRNNGARELTNSQITLRMRLALFTILCEVTLPVAAEHSLRAAVTAAALWREGVLRRLYDVDSCPSLSDKPTHTRSPLPLH